MEKILIIDDDESMRDTLKLFLADSDYEIFLAESGTQGINIMEQDHPDIVISDVMMPDINGFDVLMKSKKLDQNINVIMLTAFDDMESTIKAIQLGAYDYLSKPIEQERLKIIIKRALASKKLSERFSDNTSERSIKFKKENSLIGHAPAMKEIFKQIGHVSLNRVTVLIQGESGTGKELISKIVHYSGITKDHPFIAVNCSALTETLLESELFGHVKGAFTGALRNKKGMFELAGDGSIFLDEISETSLGFQVKLLRVIQEKEFVRVGDESTIPVKARIITSTNRNLSELIKDGKFREDLYYRLNVFNINVPPLRYRKEDIPQLVVFLLEKINRDLHKNVNKVPYETMEMLQNYNWIGNVRELENILTQAVVLAKGTVLEKEYLLLKMEENSQIDLNIPLNLSLAEVEKQYIQRVLDSVKWNKTEAKKILGIAKSTLYKKIDEYGIHLLN
ncbi:MAG: sigma-54 dependent transcriptional regulator [Ignavibacteriaceae bacterium]|jgi:DNA-binding NtrC family response regulator